MACASYRVVSHPSPHAQFFVEHYNTKKPDEKLDAAHFHLERKNAPLHGDELLHVAVQKHDDLFLRAGASARSEL